MAKRILYIDLETSGLEPSEGAVILSIGAVIDKVGNKVDKYAEYEAYILPTPEEWAKASPKALEVNGLTWEFLQEHGRPFVEVRDEFLAFLYTNGIKEKKATIVGQNPNFDAKFLKTFMGSELAFIAYPFDDIIDVRNLYSSMVNSGKTKFLKYRSGENISKSLGVEPEPFPHEALEGAKVVQRNYEKLMELHDEALSEREPVVDEVVEEDEDE